MRGKARLGFQYEQRKQGTPKREEPGDQEAHFVGGGDQRGVDPPSPPPVAPEW